MKVAGWISEGFSTYLFEAFQVRHGEEARAENEIAHMIKDIYWLRNAVMCVSYIVRDFKSILMKCNGVRLILGICGVHERMAILRDF